MLWQMRAFTMMSFERCNPCNDTNALLNPVADSKSATPTSSPTTTTNKVERSLKSDTQTEKSTEKQQNPEHTHEDKHTSTQKNDEQQELKEEEIPKITLDGPTTGKKFYGLQEA